MQHNTSYIHDEQFWSKGEEEKEEKSKALWPATTGLMVTPIPTVPYLYFAPFLSNILPQCENKSQAHLTVEANNYAMWLQ